MKKLILFGLLVVVLSSCYPIVRESVYVTVETIVTDLVLTVNATATEERRLEKIEATVEASKEKFAATETARAVEATQRAETRDQIPTRTPTPPWSSCDIKYSAVSHVMMWAEGNYAHEACEVINTRMHASTVLSNVEGSKYYVVCSDVFLDLAYEIIDTGDYAYGYEWCRWMYLQYGASAKHGQEDIFSLLEP